MKKLFLKLFFCFFLSSFFFPPHIVLANNGGDFWGKIDIWEWCDCTPLDLGCLIGCLIKFIIVILCLICMPVILIVTLILSFVGMIFAGMVQGIAEELIKESFVLTIQYLDEFTEFFYFVRDFTLWFFAVFLAFIGLATIFRIETYRARKTLVPLLIIALLFNFIPFFVKTVVKIGNSLSCSMLVTLQGIVSGGGASVGCSAGALEITLAPPTLYENFKSSLQTLAGAALKIVSDLAFLHKPNEVLGSIALLVVASIAFMLFWFGLGLAFALLAAIFLARLAFICVLFLAAPIAFTTFPFRTKEIRAAFPKQLNWDGWWEEILLWSFIGIPLAFWLSVAIFLMNRPAEIGMKVVPSIITLDPNIVSLVEACFKEVIKYIPALIALYIGLISTPGVMGSFTKGAVSVLGAIGTTAIAAGAIAAGKVGRKSLGWLGGKIEKRYPRLGTFGREMRRFAERLESVVPARATLEEAMKGIPFAGKMTERMATFEKAEKERLEAKEKEYKEWAERGEWKRLREELFSSAISAPIIGSGALQQKLIEIFVEKKKIDEEIVKKFFAGKTLEEIQRKYGKKPVDFLKKQRPDLLVHVINPETERLYTLQEIGKEILPKMTPKDVLGIKPETLEKPEFIAFMDIAQIRTIARRGKREQKEAIRKAYREGRAIFRAMAEDLQRKAQAAPTPAERNEHLRELRRLREVIAEILTNPNFHMRP